MNQITSPPSSQVDPSVERSKQQVSALSKFLKFIPLWIIPLFVSLAIFLPVQNLNLPADGAKYLSYGLNIFEGNGFSEADGSLIYRRPGLPYLIALSFKLFGPTVSSAFLVVRLFFIFEIIAVYFLCTELFNKWVGFVASLLVLSSTSLNVWSTYIHLDHIVPVFMLVYLAFSYRAMVRSSYRDFILAGVSLGIGCLVKETALLVTPVPLLTVCLTKEFWQTRVVKGLLLSYLALFIVFLPWSIYAYFGAKAGIGYAAVGSSAALAKNKLVDYDQNVAQLGIAQYFQAITTYYEIYMLPHFKMSALIVSAWVAAVVMALTKRDRAYIYFSIMLLPLLVIVLFQGTVGYRERQGIILYLLSYCALANFFFLLSKWLSNLIKVYSKFSPSKQNFSTYLALLLFTTFAIYFQLYQEQVIAGRMTSFTNEFNTLEHFTQAPETLTWSVNGRRGEVAEDVADWLLENVPEGTSFLSDAQYLSAIYFYTQANFQFHELFYPSVLWYMDETNHQTLPLNPSSHPTQPLFVWALDSSTGKLEQSRLFVLLETYLHQQIQEKSVEFIIVPPRVGFLSTYFMEAPGFSKVASFDHGAIQIFRVVDSQRTEFDLHVSTTVSPFLDTIAERNLPRYEQITDTFFQSLLGWTPNMAYQLRNNGFTSMDTDDIVQPAEFARSAYEQPVRFGTVVKKYLMWEEQLSRNAWDYLMLAQLSIADNDFESAMDSLDNMLVAANLDRVAASEMLQLLKQIAAKQPQLTETDNFKKLAEDLVDRYQLLISTNDQSVSYVYWELADLLLLLRRENESIRIYNLAAEQPRLKHSAYVRLGQLYERLDEPEKAITSYESAIELSATDVTGYISLANVYRNQGDIGTAIKTYELAIDKISFSDRLHIELGRLYKEQAESAVQKKQLD